MSACPISKNKIDSNVARVNGLTSLIIIALGVYNPIFWILLTIDFFLRSFIIKYSPIANFSKLILNNLKVIPKPIDAAPKMFAARIGFMMSIILTTISLLGYQTSAFYFSIFFSIPVFLETFLGYCLGCQMYTILTKLNIIKHKLNDNDFSSLNF
jgi:hypothetical protein